MSIFSWTGPYKPFHNGDKPPLHVNFYFLKRFDTSNFRCECPECGEGVLTMQRDLGTGELMNTNRCSLCGQQFIFDDIEFVRKAGGW